MNWLANYTFSKALGIRGENTSSGVGNPLTPSDNYGVLPNDRTHIFNLAYSYQMGNLYTAPHAFLKGVINGWQISGTTQMQSGSPLQANTSSNFNLSGFLAPGTQLPGGLGVVPTNNTGAGGGYAYSLVPDVINGLGTFRLARIDFARSLEVVCRLTNSSTATVLPLRRQDTTDRTSCPI